MSDRASYPEFFTVRQKIQANALRDVTAATQSALEQSALRAEVRAGETVAIAVGSRGIRNLREIVAATVRFIQALGAQPVVVPAMGSHGGATGAGQAALLASLGIDESLGCPVRASMDTLILGTSSRDIDIHFDRIAGTADHIIIINRVKPHTRLTGRWESGLVKMLMIGMGKHRGAVIYHQLFGRHGYRLDEIAPEIVDLIIRSVPVRLGLAIVEDAFENTSLIEAVAPADFLTREPELLAIAKTRMPGLPFDQADLLIVEKIGKEFSGTGMDTNVIGRKTHDKFVGSGERPEIREIYVRSLSEKTAGNASGIGIAEYCHRRVVAAIDHDITRINCVTAGHVTAGAVPLAFASDRAVFDAVIGQVGPAALADQRWMWISDTLHLDELHCSRAYWETARRREDLEILQEPGPLEFDAAGDVLWAGPRSRPGGSV